MPYRDSRRTLPLAVTRRCDVPWDDMVGEGPVRFCLTCRQDVHDLTALSEEEVAAVVARKDKPCVRFYESNRRSKARVIAASAALIAAAATAVVADWPVLAPDDDLVLEHEGIAAPAARQDELFEIAQGPLG